MVRQRELRVEIVDTPFDPDGQSRTIRYDDTRSRPLYKVWIYLKGPDLPYVRQVTYFLHSSFKKNIRVVRRTATNTDCRLMLKTWGVFTIRAIIETRSEEHFEISHRLTYDQKFNRKGAKFVPLKKGASTSRRRAKRVTKKKKTQRR